MPLSRTLVAAVVAALALTLIAGGSAAADPGARPQPARRRARLVFRHAATDFSKPDQDPVVVSRCATQRNLSAQGRADARAIGRGVRRLGLRVGKVFSSAYCRTLETARLAFGRATVHRALLNTITAEHDDVWRTQIRDARRLFGTKPAAGKLTALVTHGVVVQETTGQTLEEGEAIVFRPLGNSRYRIVGRVLAAGVGDAATTGVDGRCRAARHASIRCRPARIRTTSRPRRTGRSGTRLSTPASSDGSTRRRGRRRRSRSATARRRTASSSGRTAPRG